MKIKDIIEVLIHSSPQPLSVKDIKHALDMEKSSINIDNFIKKINKEYEKLGKGYRIEKIGGGYQLLSRTDYHYYIERLQQDIKKPRFSNAALETLSIIAYKQPITRIEIEHIRGVDCSGIIKKLLEKDLIAIRGRDQGLGRALLYITSIFFLESFGLDTLNDLPTLNELTDLMDVGNNSTLNEN